MLKTTLLPFTRLSLMDLQNGYKVLFLQKMGAMLLGANLPTIFWSQALEMAAEIHNVLPHSRTKIAPMDALYGKDRCCSVGSRFRIFGSKICVLHGVKSPTEQALTKTQARGFLGIYLGPASDSTVNAYIFSTGKIGKFHKFKKVISF